MRRRAASLLVGAVMLLTTACAPMMRLSPKPDAVILLPDDSKATTIEHFQRRESQRVWLFRGIDTVPTDYLAKAAPNQALRNVRFKQELDLPHFALNYVLSTAAMVATVLYAPNDYKGYGLLIYLGLGLGLPQTVHTEIEGDIAEPPTDLGKGR